MRRLIIALTASALLLMATRAHAGTYDVWGCRLASGMPTTTDGWRPSPADGTSSYSNCSDGGSLTSRLDFNTVEHWQETGWRFEAPPDTEIDNLTLIRAAVVAGHREYHLYRNFASGNAWPPARTDAERCITTFTPCGTIDSQL